jgi:hypothetical protein
LLLRRNDFRRFCNSCSFIFARRFFIVLLMFQTAVSPFIPTLP